MYRESPTALNRLPILRIGPGKVVEVRLLSSDWVRLDTHFYGRTFLCPGGDDTPCCTLLPKRPFWYLPAIVRPGARVVLLELSAKGSSELEQNAKMAVGRVRAGLVFALSRRAKKSPVRTELRDEGREQEDVPLANWFSPLMAIFGLPPIGDGEILEDYGNRVRRTARARIDVLLRTFESVRT